MKLGGRSKLESVDGQAFGWSVCEMCLKHIPQFSCHLNETCYT